MKDIGKESAQQDTVTDKPKTEIYSEDQKTLTGEISQETDGRQEPHNILGDEPRIHVPEKENITAPVGNEAELNEPSTATEPQDPNANVLVTKETGTQIKTQEMGINLEPKEIEENAVVNAHIDTTKTKMDEFNYSNNSLVQNEKQHSLHGKTVDSYGNRRDDNAIIGFIKRNLLVVLIITGALIGFIIGISINKSVQELSVEAKYNVIILIGFPGELLLRMLKMLILPLITFSLIVGVAGVDSKVSGKIGGRAVAYYMGTTCLAAIMGLILVSVIRPGNAMAARDASEKEQLVRPLDSFMDIVRNMLPQNIVKACVEQDKTIIVEMNGKLLHEKRVLTDVSNLTANQIDARLKSGELVTESSVIGNTVRKLYKEVIKEYEVYKIGKGLAQTGKANFLGLIVFAIAVGKIAGTFGSEAAIFIQFIDVFNKIITRLVVIVMWYSPIGIGSLIMQKFAEMKDIHETFSALALFIVTVVIGIALHSLVVLPGIFFLLTRTNPYKYFMGLTPAMATAFGTDSSAATLPTTFRCLEENLKIDKRITRFILPVGATINMDGTALYEAVSAIFIAQSIGRSLSFGDYVAISFTSILASVGAAAIPHAGLVTMLIVLDTVGLPTDMIAVIFSVDWFLDRVRTMSNVLGDAYGAGIVQHLSREDLRKADLQEIEEINGRTDVNKHDEKIENDADEHMTYC